MQWQDAVLAVGQWVLSLALLPSLLGEDKPAAASSLLSGSVLLVFSIVLATLSLWFAAFAVFVTSIIWFALMVQKLRQTPVAGESAWAIRRRQE